MRAVHSWPTSLRIILATALVLVWLTLAGLGGPTFGKLSQVSSNDQATFLPASADSTRASEWVSQFTESSEIPAIVVAEFPDQLAERDLGAIAAAVAELKAVDGVTDVIGPIPAEDGLAVQMVALIDTETAETRDTVDELRSLLTGDEVPSGLDTATSIHVTGPAGLSTDLASAFAGIDGLLLMVALAVVLVILVAVYRSVLLPLLVIVTSMSALCAAVLVTYWMAATGIVQLNGQSQGILSILVIGAATDYSLLLVARHREELVRHESTAAAVVAAVKGSFGAITASAATVAIALLCLLVSDLNSNRSLGPIAATGIVFAWLAALTLLPALLALCGRAAYWPARPAFDPNSAAGASHKLWSRVAAFVQRKPRAVWMLTLVVLVAGAVWVPTLKAEGVAQSDVILGESDAKQGQVVLGEHFSAGAGSPTTIITPEAHVDEVMTLLSQTDGVAQATLTSASGAPANTPPLNEPPKVLDGRVFVQVTLTDPADSHAAEQTVSGLRATIDRAIDSSILVGGPTAVAIDSNDTAQRDLITIIPLVLAVVLLILMVLLRAILLPLLLVAATVVSFGTAMGVSALVFNHVFQFPGADPTVPLYGFVFLVALGIDYTIFLMTRAREEAATEGTRRGVLSALTVTGGVITSAGVVLAATFAALGVIPLMFMIQLAFIVAFGVLIDTLIVRTLLVPGLVLDIGPRVWWPFVRQADPLSRS